MEGTKVNTPMLELHFTSVVTVARGALSGILRASFAFQPTQRFARQPILFSAETPRLTCRIYLAPTAPVPPHCSMLHGVPLWADPVVDGRPYEDSGPAGRSVGRSMELAALETKMC